ncbi:type II secretion system F family protein [Arthrobacter sp. NA-172]|uniref:type II secretion system F family protein n=1 Tax=Arthrobacter sp. NA-172 TaxID=3367524 RepID=UPI003753FAEB
MDPTFPAVAVSMVLISAVVLEVALPGTVRRRTLLRTLHGAPGSTAPLKEARQAPDLGTAPSFQGHGGLGNVPMMLELVAAMLDSGAGLGRSLELIASCASRQLSRSLRIVVAGLDVGTDWETAWRSSGEQCAEARKLKDALSFAALTGAPSAAILYAQAARLRREQFRAAEKRAAALGVKLVIPLGLCSLPAFICLGVVPVLLAMLPSAE